MPRERESTKSKATRHNPLAYDILEANSTLAKSKPTSGRKGQYREEARTRITANSGNNAKINESLLSQARKQQKEEEHPVERKTLPNYADSDSDEFSDDGETGDFDEIHEEIMIEENDEQALSMFMKGDSGQRKTIADIVMEKIKEFEQRQNAPAEKKEQSAPKLHPKIIQVYKGVGQVMKHYSAGKVPKAFKVIPSLNNWEEIVFLTSPQEWSLPSYYVATRLFASNLNERMAQRFFSVILLPKVMEDITENKRLNYHLYRALKKAVYKPSAFYKGIILPICDQGCGLHEAAIIASILNKVSVPVLPSSAALHKMCQLPYSGQTNIFMKALLNKKYALPYRVIDRLVEYFSAFSEEKRKLPVMWHQSVLILAQRYKEELTKEQKEAIKSLIKIHNHSQIAPEIHRELDSSCSRGESLNAAETAAMMLD